MRYTISIPEGSFARLTEELFSVKGCEGAAYLLCGVARSGSEIRLVVRDVVPVSPEDYLIREPFRLSIKSRSYVVVAKRAAAEGAAVVFVHCHPGGSAEFSPQDDREEPGLMRFLRDRAGELPHGSLVLSDEPGVAGRVWTDGGWMPMDVVRVLGRKFQFLTGRGDVEPIPTFFDRQVRAFGPEVQRLLSRLHVGVVGAGGTGSAVAEQLGRLGVGKISIFDGDAFDSTNSNRVYGSSVQDAGRNKALIAANNISRQGLGADVRPFERHITYEGTARELRNCDVAFGCTDLEAPRGILMALSVEYLIPVIDVGVIVDSSGGVIGGVFGRVTVVAPGEACLFCRNRISAKTIALESKSADERQRLHAEGYAPELRINNPAVIMFTTAVAAQAVSEFLHRLTGFMGEDRTASEALLLIHADRLGVNRASPSLDCLCTSASRIARGDRQRGFLGLTWPAS